MDWLEDSVSFLPSFLDDPFNSGEINGYQWWDESQDIAQDLTDNGDASLNSPWDIATASTTITKPDNSTISDPLSHSNSSKKRKPGNDPAPKASQTHLHHSQRKNQGQRVGRGENGDTGIEEVFPIRKANGNRKNSAKGTGNNCHNGNTKEGRWAEQLLNPCASAITEGNYTRVQHLLYVLHELASLSGDANHRLAFHGLRALTHHLSSSSAPASTSTATFATSEPRFFQKSLIKFHEVSPWFSFPNSIANASILQLLCEENRRTGGLHILDIGVSHGVQWPILLEALTRRPGGPPPLVRITVVSGPTAETDQNAETPFAIGPLGDNFSSRLLGFAKSMNINLQINRLENQPLQKLNPKLIESGDDETLIICAQFRLHSLSHAAPDERTEFLKTLRKMKPKGVILSESDAECGCGSCRDFGAGFARRVEHLWRFLDSTSAAFKGRESEERRLMECEAARALASPRAAMSERRDGWCERMREAGFASEALGEDAIDGARALLRKYDGNWEMRVHDAAAGDGFAGLWWKGQPVSFCSLWKLDKEGK